MGFYGTKDPLTGEETVERTYGESKWNRPPTYSLLPCPKCGTTQAMNGGNQIEPCVNLIGVFAGGDKGGWTIGCRKCSYSFPEPVEDPDEAIREWNRNCGVMKDNQTIH